MSRNFLWKDLTNMVGREQLVEKFTRQLEQTGQQEAFVAYLIGEGGTGKTRMFKNYFLLQKNIKIRIYSARTSY